MKTNKKALAILTAGLLAVTPMAATGLTAFAANSTNLTVVDSDTVAHDYEAYQILKGDTDDAGKLQNLSMGDGITQANLITAINATLGAGTLASTATLDEIAVTLATITSDSDNAAALSKEIAKYKIAANAKELTHGSGADADKYTNSTLANGWYLILDETDPLAAATTTSSAQIRSANILELTQSTTINTKHSLPTIDKVIVEGAVEKDANTAAIGDVVTYSIKLKVPETTGYNKYFYVVTDTLSPGLTYKETTSVTIDGNAITEDTTPETSERGKYNIAVSEYSTSSGTTIKYVFEDFLGYVKNTAGVAAGDDIIITYTATLNQNAVVTDAGNPNKVKLAYSNDPNHDYEGTPATTPDEPASGEPTGETPEDEVTTYTTAVKIRKVDQAGNKLTGAKFVLESNSDLNEVKVISGTSFAQDNTNGNYYKLKDGSYTLTAPPTDTTDPNYALYDTANISNKFKKTSANGTITEKATGTPLSVEAEVDSDGYITFSGLKPGTYTLRESKAPEGYNAASDVTFTITASNPLTGPSNWTSNNANVSYNGTHNAFYAEIENRYGATLPTTGGIGTKLFYIIGGMLVAGSVVLLVTKKRMNLKED